MSCRRAAEDQRIAAEEPLESSATCGRVAEELVADGFRQQMALAMDSADSFHPVLRTEGVLGLDF